MSPERGVVAGGLQAGLLAFWNRRLVRIGGQGELGRPCRLGVERVPQRVGQHGDRGERDRRRRHSAHLDDAIDDLQVAGVGLEGVARDPQRLVAYLARRGRDGVSTHHQSPRGEGSDGVAEPPGVSGDDGHAIKRHPEDVGCDLGECRLVTLALGGEAGGDHDGSVGLDLDPAALVRPDAGALDVARDADADPTALRPSLLAIDPELVPTDQLLQLPQGGRIVAGVIDEGAAVLEDQAVVIGHLLGLDEVALPDLGPVKSEFGGDRVHDPLHHEAALRVARRRGRE